MTDHIPDAGKKVEGTDGPDGMLAYYISITKKDRSDPNWPLPSFDAQDWAEAFVAKFPSVPYDMALGWFANALMRGFDEATIRRTDND